MYMSEVSSLLRKDGVVEVTKDDGGVLQFPGKKATAKPSIAFGSIIRNYRLKANLEQGQVGQACGLTGNAISNWERGVSRPDITLVPILCKTLNMPVEAFFEIPSHSTLSGNEQSVIDGYRSMTPPNKKLLMKAVDAILESQEEARRENYRKSFCRLVGHDLGLAAGFGAPVDDDPDAYPVFVRVSREACQSDDVFPVNGESMEPDYPNGSLVFVERVDVDNLQYGDIVACMASGVPYVKIYEKDGLHSINPSYDVIHVTEDDNARIFGRVVGLVPEGDLATKAETADLLEVFADEIE
ncbi:MAG: hypothetical protein DBX91_01435 [Subdoligranulum variabile]|nr:MAG: hypothetical protein DBX91_01435 [Subdoligranulum variabile]